MELDDIKRYALAARQFQVVQGGATFTLTLPTKLQSSIAYVSAQEQSDQLRSATGLRFQRALLVLAMTEWAGVPVKWAWPDYTGDELLPFEAGAAELLLDADPQLETVLMGQLMERITQRKSAMDTAEKN